MTQRNTVHCPAFCGNLHFLTSKTCLFGDKNLLNLRVYVTICGMIISTHLHILCLAVLIYVGCSNVIISAVTMVVATTPCCRYEQHCHYMRFYVTIVNQWRIFLGYFCSSKRSSISRHGRTGVIYTFTKRIVYLQHGVELLVVPLSPYVYK